MICPTGMWHSLQHTVLVHEVGKTQPPELSGDKLVDLEITRVTSGLVVMTPGKDRATEGALQRDVDSAFVCKDMVIELPIREPRSEGCGDVLQGQL